MYPDDHLISATELSFTGVLNDVKKARTALQPVYEAFTNALEAIRARQRSDEFFGQISVRIDSRENLLQTEFDALTVIDDGIGFNDEEFKRFNTYKEGSKGFKNLGSGRFQYAHYFDTTTVTSNYQQEGRYFERKFVVSKKPAFISKNALVKHIYNRASDVQEHKTEVTFRHPYEKSTTYDDLTDESLKAKLLERYAHYFCNHKGELPDITIEFFVGSELRGTSKITDADIPDPEKTENTTLQYSRKVGNTSEKIEKSEDFVIQSFALPPAISKENKLSLISKGELVEDSPVTLQNLANTDSVHGKKYLFLVSSDYIDARDSDVRGELNIPDRDSFEKGLFGDEEILIEDIQDEINQSIDRMYPEIREVKEQHIREFEELKEMFLLDEETAKDITLSINDSEKDILRKFYEAEAKKAASIDASIKESIDELDNLDPRAPNYGEELEKQIDKLTSQIPQQNRKALTHYVARRKLVLELFDKILQRKLAVQGGRANDEEALIHNLLFHKKEADAESSDLWMISEDFIYFRGTSDKRLSKAEIGGKLLFKTEFEEEEERYLKSLGEDRTINRPDVLLFPEEGKCIIIEFKAPDVNVSKHLTQIDFYAYLIQNYTADDFQITTFYGYLLGESIEPRDVLGRVSNFEESYQFDYLFRPSTKVNGFDGRSNGSIYTEVIKYSTLLARAKQRNSIFINKLK